MTEPTYTLHAHVLLIYLRDYYSRYHARTQKCHDEGDHICRIPLKVRGDAGTDAECVIAYWEDVERPPNSSRKLEKGEYIANKLSWPRTALNVSITEDIALKHWPCSLAQFRGVVQLEHRGAIEECTYDALFRQFSYIQSLNMLGCSQTTIADDLFRHLANLRSLSIGDCNQNTITDEAFAHLTNLQTLAMAGCHQSTITDETFFSLGKLVLFEYRKLHERLQPRNDHKRSLSPFDEIAVTENELVETITVNDN